VFQPSGAIIDTIIRRHCKIGRGREVSIDHYTYRLTWSVEDREHVGLCSEFPSLSWLAPTQAEALSGIRQVVTGVVADLQENGKFVP
jgi:predicted RNase H-like HicB family nuclease